MKYTITNIDFDKGHVSFKLEDNVVHTVCDIPVSPRSATEDGIERFASSYTLQVPVVPDPEVVALIGKEQEIVKIEVNTVLVDTISVDEKATEAEVEQIVLDAINTEKEVLNVVTTDDTVDVTVKAAFLKVETPVEVLDTPVLDTPVIQ